MIDFIKNCSFKIPDLLNSDETVAIIIGKVDETQLHCGIGYKTKESFNIIHLAWHNYLKNESKLEEKFKDYYWIKSAIPEIRQPAIAAYCRLVWSRNSIQKIPYGLKFYGSPFDKDGILKLNNAASGLTCATFVLSLFEEVGINLISINDWPQRKEDKIWHNKIIDSLKLTKNQFNISDEHIQNVELEKGCSRFRPQEVSISSAYSPTPHSSLEIINSGEILNKLIISID